MTDEQYGEKLPDKKTVNQLWQDLKAAWEPLKGVAFSGTEAQIKARKNINDIQSKMRDMGIKSRGQLIEVTDWDKPREEREKSPTQQLREEIDE